MSITLVIVTLSWLVGMSAALQPMNSAPAETSQQISKTDNNQVHPDSPHEYAPPLSEQAQFHDSAGLDHESEILGETVVVSQLITIPVNLLPGRYRAYSTPVFDVVSPPLV